MSEVLLTAYYDNLRRSRVEKLQNRLNKVNQNLAENGPEKVALSLKLLYEVCLDLDQTEPVYGKDLLETQKLCQINAKMSKELLEDIYGQKIIKIPYYGLFTVVDGILTSHNFKVSSGYDRWEGDVQRMLAPISVASAVEINFSRIPSGYRPDLVSVAVDGLFFPKACPFVNLFRRHQLTFFNVNDYDTCY